MGKRNCEPLTRPSSVPAQGEPMTNGKWAGLSFLVVCPSRLERNHARLRQPVPTLSRRSVVPDESRNLLARLTSHVPQFSRYTMVGIFNTIFGYGLYAGLTAFFTPRVAHGYLLAAIVSSLIGISVAFLGYKWFVFKTKGNYFREWVRCHLVYGTTTLISILLLPPCVLLFRRFAGLQASAPYVAGAVVTALNVAISFMGHKKFSFSNQG